MPKMVSVIRFSIQDSKNKRPIYTIKNNMTVTLKFSNVTLIIYHK